MKKPDVVAKILKLAAKRPGTIVFPEGTEPRIIEAIRIIVRRKLALPVLLGPVEKIRGLLKKAGVNAEKVLIVSPKSSSKLEVYAKELYRIRKSKGLTLVQARKLASDETYFGTLMVHMNDADGLVSGSVHSTADTVRPALQIIKTHKKYNKVSGLFLMMLDDGDTYMFADCAVTINPTAVELAQIAKDSAITAKKFGINPRVAMLSFSTNGSAKADSVLKVKKAVELFKRKCPKAPIIGDVQVDAALVPAIRKIKFPNCPFKKNANVLIFPDLNSGNISYKLVERLAGAKAVGPILQGLNKPVNDLSRGCSVEDIVDVTAITVVEANHDY